MTDLNICPECQYENEPALDKCVNCGASLTGRTTLWKKDPFPDAVHRPAPVRPDREFEPETLYLYVVGGENADPLRFRGSGSITLGRKNPDGSTVPDLLDLNPYHAFSLGVSRQHARINHDEGKYSVEDLNSSNGTLLNGNRLETGRAYPLRSGDYLQLGELLIYLYFIGGTRAPLLT